MAGQVEVGAGPLHTQFDSQGHGYTSLFLANAIAKFTLGEDVVKTGEEPFTLIETIPTNYNIGHLATAEGDTVSPDDNYMVALNKWSIDRFAPQGPLHPQNFQLIDLKGGTGPMELIADMPIGVGEPHYVQIIKADKLQPLELYEPGTDPLTMGQSEFAIVGGEEKVERNGNNVEVWMSATRSHFTAGHHPCEAGRHGEAAHHEHRADPRRDARVRYRATTTSRRVWSPERWPTSSSWRTSPGPSTSTARSSAPPSTWRWRAGCWSNHRKSADDELRRPCVPAHPR